MPHKKSIVFIAILHVLGISICTAYYFTWWDWLPWLGLIFGFFAFMALLFIAFISLFHNKFSLLLLSVIIISISMLVATTYSGFLLFSAVKVSIVYSPRIGDQFIIDNRGKSHAFTGTHGQTRYLIFDVLEGPLTLTYSENGQPKQIVIDEYVISGQAYYIRF